MDADPHHGEANHGMLQFEQKEQDQLRQQSRSLNYDLRSNPISGHDKNLQKPTPDFRLNFSQDQYRLTEVVITHKMQVVYTNI